MPPGSAPSALWSAAVRTGVVREDDYRLLGEGLAWVVVLAREVGLVPSFHPHLGTIVESPPQITQVFRHTGINFCPDTAHLQAAGGDPADLIRT